MTCRSPFSSTHHGTTGFWSRLEPPRWDRRATWIIGRVDAPKGPQIGGFFGPLGPHPISVRGSLRKVPSEGCARARVGDGLGRGTNWSATGSKVPAFHRHDERDSGRRRLERTPPGPTAPPSQSPPPDSWGFVTKLRIHSFLTNYIINKFERQRRLNARFQH